MTASYDPAQRSVGTSFSKQKEATSDSTQTNPLNNAWESDNATAPRPRMPRPEGARPRAQQFKNPPLTQEQSQAPITHGYVKGFDGTKLFYSVEGSGPPLVFCYGLVCSSLHWTYQIEYFKKNYQTVWFDYRGHQNSDTPADLRSITIENIARDLGAIMDELNLPKATLLGHSMGVNVVLDFYRQFPNRVKAMVLANGTPKRPLETLMGTNFTEVLFSAARKVHQFSPRVFRHLWDFQKNNPIARTMIGMGGFNPHLTPPEDVELYVNQVIAMDPAILLQLIENYGQADATPWLHTVDVPTLILSGENDRVTPVPQQQLMHQLIPNSKMEFIRHGSHCSQMDLPDLINLKIERFLQSIDSA